MKRLAMLRKNPNHCCKGLSKHHLTKMILSLIVLQAPVQPLLSQRNSIDGGSPVT
jgi:hypothetical protein